MSIGSQLTSFLNSAQGRRLVDRGQRELSKPENQAKIKKALDSLTKRR